MTKVDHFQIAHWLIINRSFCTGQPVFTLASQSPKLCPSDGTCLYRFLSDEKD